jgi:acyl-CoA reductase-like NAD-dependent aldehyde dehydrogenase
VGPFQFLERTWLDMMRRHGAAYGLGSLASAITVRDGAPTVANPEVRKEILALRQDPDLAAGMAARCLSECRDRLSHGLGRPATETEAYIAYVMGPRGAARLIRAADMTPKIAARQILPAAAAANHALFHHPSHAPMTAGEVVAALKRRIDAAQLKLASLVPADPAPEVNDGPAQGLASVFVGQEVDQETG